MCSVLGRCLSGDCTLLSTSECQQILLLVVKVCTVTIMKIILHCVQHLQYVFKIHFYPHMYIGVDMYVYDTIL